jgi:hypothetical protein
MLNHVKSGGGKNMKDQKDGIIKHNREHQKDSLIKRAILDLLLAQKTQPGASIDLILTEHELKRCGINKREFSQAIAQLLDLGLIEMRGNTFHLSNAGFNAFQQDKQGERTF